MAQIQTDQPQIVAPAALQPPPAAHWAPLVEIALILILAIVPIVRALPPGRIFVPANSFDQIDPTDPRATARESAAWIEFAADQLKAGNTPLWYPTANLGLPLIAIGQSGILFPTTFLHLLLPPRISWALSAWLKFSLAGVGAWLLARRYKLPPIPRVTAATAFMFCGLLTLAPHGAAANVTAMLPWMILAIDKILRRATPATIAVGALATGLTFLGGDPPAIISAILAAIIYLIFISITHSDSPATRLKNAAAVIFALLIGILLGGAQLIPLAEYIANLPMISAPSVHHWQSLPLFDGASRIHWWAPPMFGAVLILLAIIAIITGRRDKIVRQLLVMTASLLLLETLAVAYAGLRLPASIAITFVGPGLFAAPLLALSILAAIGIARIDQLPRLDLLRKAAIIVAALAIACVIAGIVEQTKAPWILTKGARLIAAAAVLGLLWILRSRAKSASLTILALAAVELLAPTIFFNTAARAPLSPSPADLPAVAMPTYLENQILAKDSPASRIFKTSDIAWATATTDHLDTREDVLTKMANPSIDPTKIILSDRKIENPFDAPLLPTSDLGKLPWFARAASNAGPDIPSVKSNEPGDIKISLAPRGGGWLALRQRFYPGWQAQVITPTNPEIKPLIVPIVRAFACMQCILIPRAATEVTFVYDPQSWRWGCFASAAGALAILLLLGLTLINTLGKWKGKWDAGSEPSELLTPSLPAPPASN